MTFNRFFVKRPVSQEFYWIRVHRQQVFVGKAHAKSVGFNRYARLRLCGNDAIQ